MKPKSSNQTDQQDIYIDEFDFNKFKDVYNRDVDDIRTYVEKCSKNKDYRKNKWSGKSDDLKKHSVDAFPYQYASDSEVFTIDRSIQNGVALTMNGMNRSQIRAYPRMAEDAERSAEVSVMLRWMRDAGIESFQREMELASSYWLEKGLAVTYCGWKAKDRSMTKTYDIDEVMKSIPELPEVEQMEEAAFLELMMDEDRLDELLAFFNQVDNWEVNEARLKKALKQLRKEGVAEIPYVIKDEGTFDVRTLPPDADFIAPSFVTNIQEAPRLHMRMLMTGQQLLNYQATGEWDKEWCDWMIQNHTGVTRSEFFSPDGTLGYNRYDNQRTSQSGNGSDARDFIEVVFTYERLIDEEDGAEGMYLTVWSPKMAGEVPDVPVYAYRKLQSGRKWYPFVVTPLSYESKTLYSSTTWPELLKSAQKTQKVVIDSYIDEAAWSASPPMWGAPGVDMGQYGPGARVNGPVGREPKFIQKPSDFSPNIQLLEIMSQESMQHIGLSPNDPLSEARQRHIVDSFLRRHVQSVLAMAYDTFKLEGPDELYFRVTGKKEGISFINNRDEAEMDMSISFNSTFDQPEQLKELSEVMQTAKQLSPARVGSDEMASWLLNAADPSLAEVVLVPEAQGSARITDETLDDIQRMSSGIPAGAREDAAEARIEIVNQYIAQQQQYEQAGIPTLFGQSQQFQQLVTQYLEQLQFQADQMVNANEYGKLGARAAKMGDMNVQGVQDQNS